MSEYGPVGDHWIRMPNTAGRERGPIYIRNWRTPHGILGFRLTPNWERSSIGRYPSASKVVDSGGWHLVKRGYVVEGLPLIHSSSGVALHRVQETLAEGKRMCERFATEVIAGERDILTGDRIKR